MQFINVHLASPHNQLSAVRYSSTEAPPLMRENIKWRAEQAEQLNRIARSLGGPVLLAGGFKTTGEGSIYRRSLSSFSDAFNEAGFGFGWTYHAKVTQTRIDHILTGAGWQVQRCWVGPDISSTHRPVIAEMEWTKAR